MKQDVNPSLEDEEEDEMEVTIDNMATDIVEDFARQLDRVVRLQHDEEEDAEDEEEGNDFGYQQLPQDEGDTYQPLESDDEEEEDKMTMEMQNPLAIEIESSARLNAETSDLIKSIMTNIQLSNDAIPEWAKKVPESAWLPRVSK